MQKCFYRRISRFWWIFVAENTAAEDLALYNTKVVEIAGYFSRNTASKYGICT